MLHAPDIGSRSNDHSQLLRFGFHGSYLLTRLFLQEASGLWRKAVPAWPLLVLLKTYSLRFLLRHEGREGCQIRVLYLHLPLS